MKVARVNERPTPFLVSPSGLGGASVLGVQTITANGSDTVLGPIVNFAAGSNVILAVSSNTINIASVASGGGGSGTLTTVKDEGSVLSAAAVSLDFVGAGVTVTGTTAVTVTIPGGGGGGGAPLAVLAYQGGAGDATYATGSTSFVDVDATNVKVTFTAPASGNVLVHVFLPSWNNSAANGTFINLRESSTDIGFWLLGSTTAVVPGAGVFLVTGISAGSHTYKLGYRVLSGAGTIYYGSATRGPIVMEVWAAP